MRERIAGLISGVLPEAEMQALEQHLKECSACRGYADALQKEDELLSGLFGRFDSGMRGREDEVINALSRVGASGRRDIISAGRTIIGSLLSKHAAAAAVIIVVTLYFIITFTWVSQINAVIRHGL